MTSLARLWRSNRCGALAVGLALFGCNDSGSTPDSDKLRQVAVEEGRRAYATIDHITDVRSQAAVRHAMEAASFDDQAGLETAQVDALVEQVAEFLFMRFGQDSPAQYRAWRAARGDEWREWSYLRDIWNVSKWYEAHVGEPIPDGAGSKMDEVFDRLWIRRAEMYDGFNRLDSIAAEPKGLAVVIARATLGDPLPKMVHGEMNERLWYGEVEGTHCSWWQPRVTIASLLENRGEAIVATVGVVAQFGERWRRPLIMMYVWDPMSSAWVLETLNTTNYASGKSVPIDY